MSKLHLLAATTLFCMSLSANSMAQGNWVQDSTHVQGNNTIKLKKSDAVDVLVFIDPVTKNDTTIKRYPIYVPVSVNGKPVVKEKPPYTMGGNLQKAIVEDIKKQPNLKKLPDGEATFRLRNVVLDRKGNMVYAEYEYDLFQETVYFKTMLSPCITSEMISRAIKSNHWSPSNEYTLLHTDLEKVKFRVKAGKVSIVPAY